MCYSGWMQTTYSRPCDGNRFLKLLLNLTEDFPYLAFLTFFFYKHSKPVGVTFFFFCLTLRTKTHLTFLPRGADTRGWHTGLTRKHSQPPSTLARPFLTPGPTSGCGCHSPTHLHRRQPSPPSSNPYIVFALPSSLSLLPLPSPSPFLAPTPGRGAAQPVLPS